MLFNSLKFFFVFLPFALFPLFFMAKRTTFWSTNWLLLSSIVFYGDWSASHLPLLFASVTFNFLTGRKIGINRSLGNIAKADWFMRAAIAANISLLIYYKYAGFLITSINSVANINIPVISPMLPLGISFFTFTQIAFLVDARSGKTAEMNFFRYGLFVTYFPHLIAGPILHHREMMQQFERKGAFHLSALNLSAGLSLFVIGLIKKVIIADSLAPIADTVFSMSTQIILTFAEGWTGAIAYSLQLYFDFSGYCDMALGLSLMMGIRMPVNFNSPYKSVSIIEFWRRWHMTLSRFLRDYLYIPLGGNRHGPKLRHANLLVTMLLGGLWHGAGWTFVLWGGLHGLYLVINHGWQALPTRCRQLLPRSAAGSLTFFAVVIAWVFFRAASIKEALTMLNAMSGANGLALPSPLATLFAPLLGNRTISGGTFGNGLFDVYMAIPLIGAGLLLVLVAPNSQEIMSRVRPALTASPIKRPRLTWSPSWAWGCILGTLTALCITMMSGQSPFLYFRF